MFLDIHILIHHIARMSTIDHIRHKRNGLIERRNAILDEVKDIDNELTDLDAAERVLQNIMTADIKGNGERQDEEQEALPASFKGTIQDLVMVILIKAYPRGLRSADMRRMANDYYAKEINKNSLTVVLSRMKSKLLIKNEGQTWFYLPNESSKIPEEETPPEQPDEAA